ncbi:hypothetical protein EMWEY_00039840 [Eimeria maxima]|uniref:Uncharacterized protein n=1 Tax=Eimeria maxima TaxID=5804 RepID=U6MFS6_EIMMA|nr:hypothetical protein EMWEY_00039840 [Eimeria maxima]CDJ61314.1 hypothetical protein EMWEY_00039840 [Eimeria maxima]
MREAHAVNGESISYAIICVIRSALLTDEWASHDGSYLSVYTLTGQFYGMRYVYVQLALSADFGASVRGSSCVELRRMATLDHALR